jgi:hypothetical protein
MFDLRESHSALSRFRAQTGNRIASASIGGYAGGQRLIRDLLQLVTSTPGIGVEAKQAGLPDRATRDYAITDRILNMDREDINHATELVAQENCLGALSYVFGTAKQRERMQESFSALEVAS